MPALIATNVRKTYRLGKVDVPVLKGIDLTVNHGEFVAILGASGSGKSTLMHILGGLDKPDPPNAAFNHPAANIIVGGINVSQLSGAALNTYRAQTVGFVFQFYHLLPELTVMENVIIAAMVKGGSQNSRSSITSGDTANRAKALLNTFGLSHRLAHRPAELSGGERQRVAMARALINDPPFLLADEPTGNLDAKTGESVLNMLVAQRASQQKRTMLIVTHSNDVASRADRVIRLVDGLVDGSVI